MSTLIHRRVQACREGSFDQMICRVNAGWVVMGDVQVVPGYCLLLPDPVVPNLNAMNLEQRTKFLSEMSIVGDAVLEITDAIRINYEMIGNVEPALHAHLFPRYASETEELRLKPIWFYDWDEAKKFDLESDQSFMKQLALKLANLGISRECDPTE